MSRWVQSLEELAREVLPEPVHRYFRKGALDGISMGEAAAAWNNYRFLAHVLRDVTSVDTSTSLLGTTVRSPFAVAPTTLQRAAHVDGEIAMAGAVAAAGSLLVVSSNAGSTFAAIADTGVDWWLQVYVPAARPTCKPLLDQAVAAGAKAVVLTADTPVVGRKYDGAGRTVWDMADPQWLRANFPDGYGTSPGDEKATDLGGGSSTTQPRRRTVSHRSPAPSQPSVRMQRSTSMGECARAARTRGAQPGCARGIPRPTARNHINVIRMNTRMPDSGARTALS